MTLPLDVLEGRAEWVVVTGDCLLPDGLPNLPAGSVHHVITDPPFSKHVHANARTNKKTDDAPTGIVAIDKRMEIKFAHLADEDRAALCREWARLATRWQIAFCAVEDVGGWKVDYEAAGSDYIRTGGGDIIDAGGTWIREGTMPQVSGDRPAQGFEHFTIAHAPGRKRWNGGGKPAVYRAQIAGKDTVRYHETEKPLDLMLRIVEDFTDPGDIILDPFAGSGTTGVACVRLGRRFIGYERDPKHAATAVKRLTATHRQDGLFDRACVPKPKQLKLVEG